MTNLNMTHPQPTNLHIHPLGPTPLSDHYLALLTCPHTLTAIRTHQIHPQHLPGSIDFLLATSNTVFPGEAAFRANMAVPFYSCPRRGGIFVRAAAKINSGRRGGAMVGRHVGVRPPLMRAEAALGGEGMRVEEWKVMFEHTYDYLEDLGEGWRVEVSLVKFFLGEGEKEEMEVVRRVGSVFVPGRYAPEPVECRKRYKMGFAGRDEEGLVGVEVRWGVDMRGG